MRKSFILSLLALGLLGCETYNRGPYTAYKPTRGDYGFTYDLDNQPTPYEDTGYRPLTPFDLKAPIIVVVTNQPPPKIVYKTEPEIGVTRYAGETPTRVGGVGGASPQIIESAGAGGPTASAPAGAGTGGYGAPGYGSGGGGGGVFFPGTNIVATNTNGVTNIGNITNTNAVGQITNTNISVTNISALVTNTNGFAVITNIGGTNQGTNQLINEAAGARFQTNPPVGRPRTNQFGQPATGTNRVLLNQPANQAPAPTVQSPPAQNPQFPAPSGVQSPPAQAPQAPAAQPPVSAPPSPSRIPPRTGAP